MDFKQSIIKTVAKDTEYTITKVEYIDDKFYCTINKVQYLIEYDITKYKTLYSLPINDYYEPWAKKKVKDNVKSIANLAWSPIKPKQKIKGKIKDNLFILK